MNTFPLALTVLSALWLGTASARAQVTWRVSVKIFLGSNNQRPGSPPITNAEIQAQFDFANTNRYLAGRGLQLVNTEIVQVSPPANSSTDWFNADLSPAATRSALEAAAKANAAYAWRTDAINIYINDGTPNGAGSFPSSGESITVIGANKTRNTPWVFIHEIGHFMSLFHTHQGQNCTDDDSGCVDCPNPQSGNDDQMDDTLPDHKCFDQDELTQESFGSTYAAASAIEQVRVDHTFFNIMSYHANRFILTTQQLDAMCDTSNVERDLVSHNEFIFVDPFAFGINATGASPISPFGGPFKLLTSAVDAAETGDVLLLRPGNFTEARELRKPITLRAVQREMTVAGHAIIRAR